MTGAAQSARLEDPTESAPAAQEAADEIVDRFVAHLRLSVGQQLRLAQVRERLIGLGVHPASPAYARYLSPLICATPEEQAQLLTDFAELEARLRREGLAPPIPAVSDTASPLVTPPVARPKTPWWRSVPGLTALGALTLTVMGVALLLILYVPPQTGTPPTTLPEFIRELTNQPIPPTRQTHEAPNGWWFHSKLTPWAVIGLIPLLATLLAAVVIFARRFQAFRPQPDQARKTVLPIVLDGHFADLASSRAVLDLGRYIAGMGRRLHVRRTLRATLRNGGFPTPRFGGRAHAPDYVALVERQSPRDHLPLISDVLGRRFHSQFVALSRFAFRREPSLLRSLDDPGAGDIHLEELTSAMPEARWLIIAEAEPLFLQPGRLAPWLQRLIDTGKVAFFNPRGRGDWEEDEHILRRAGVAVLSATSGGLRNYADWLLSDGAAEGKPAQTEAAGVDLPFHLARHQAQLLDESLSDVAFEGLMNDLKAWLGEPGMRLFRALAIYPRLEPSLTLALGRALSREAGPEPRPEARPSARSETGPVRPAAFPVAVRRVARLISKQASAASSRNDRAHAKTSTRKARFARTRPATFTRLLRLFGSALTLATAPAAAAAPAPHTPLLDDDLLVRLVRLPWLRLGYMPSSFRRRLARRITASDLATTVRVVEAFLLADAEAVLDPSARPPADRDLLIRWLKTHRDTDLHDTILIDALSGRRPDEPKAPKGALARARALIPGLSDPPLVIAVVLGLMLMWLQPQTVTRVDPSKTPPPEQQPQPPAKDPPPPTTQVASNGVENPSTSTPLTPPTERFPGLRPRVYFQISAEAQRDQARALQEILGKADIGGGVRPSVPGVELAAAVSSSVLRCFTDTECSRAAIILAQINRYLASPAHLENVSRTFPDAAIRENHYELWLATNAFGASTEGGTSGESTEPRPADQRGSFSLTDVRSVPSLLSLLGFYQGGSDDSQDPVLVAALKAWQASRDLPQEGFSSSPYLDALAQDAAAIGDVFAVDLPSDGALDDKAVAVVQRAARLAQRSAVSHVRVTAAVRGWNDERVQSAADPVLKALIEAGVKSQFMSVRIVFDESSPTLASLPTSERLRVLISVTTASSLRKQTPPKSADRR